MVKFKMIDAGVKNKISICRFTATPLLVALICIFSSMSARAAQSFAPGAGTLLQEQNQSQTPIPSPSATGLKPQQTPPKQIAYGHPFKVTSLHIEGNTIFSTAVLHTLVANAEGQQMDLVGWNAVADRITTYYHDHGYMLSRAVIPAQSISSNGVMTIDVLEPHFESLMIDNHSIVDKKWLTATLDNIQPNDFVEQKKLNHTLLLLSDIPGTLINATLTPGTNPDTSDLLVNVEPSSAIYGNVNLDNYGNPYTGDVRLGSTVNFVNLLNHGDIFTLSGDTSGKDMDYGRASYEWLVNGQGTRAGGAYSVLRYILGAPLTSLDAHGTADVASVWVKHPFERSKTANLYGQLEYDHEQLNDDIDSTSINNSRHLDNLTGTLSGDSRDRFFSGGANTWTAGFTSGRVTFDNVNSQLYDAANPVTQGEFTKWNGTFVRLQNLSDKNSLYFLLSGQWASKNLDYSQKMIGGGPFTVRAYGMGILSGDDGALFTTEFRRQLGDVEHGQLQGIVFYDDEHLTINQNPWSATYGTVNTANLEGIGAGLNWQSTNNQWAGKVYLATPVGTTPALLFGQSKSVDAWIEINKMF
jgi:hemolysin activation/secretion protein